MKQVALAVSLLAAVWASTRPAMAAPDENGGEEREARVAVFVVATDGALSDAHHATLLLTMERLLDEDPRLSIVDTDRALARAADAIPEADIARAREQLREGLALADRAENTAALARLQSAEKRLRAHLSHVPADELARAQLALGAAHARTGDSDRAIAVFARLLAWRPDLPTDAPELGPLLARARQQLARAGRGGLDIATRPEGALAYVDGELVGFTPVRVDDLAAGEHLVTLKVPGHTRVARLETVRAGTTTEVQAELPPTPRRARLDRLVAELDAGLGEATAPPVIDELGRILSVEHVVVVRVPVRGGGTYQALAYEVASRRQLAVASTGASPDLDHSFGELAATLYADFTLAPPPPPERDAAPRPLYRRWWVWAGVAAAVATAVAVPVILLQRDEPPTCPPGMVCGDVILRF